MRYKRTVLGTSQQFFYVHLKFTQEIVVEVPRGLLNQRQSDLVGQGFTEKAIALNLARDVALKMASPFPAIGERAAGLYDEDPPIWYEYRHRVMNQRPCDHEERGIRAWKIA
jgi:hypothetical protein